MARAEREERAQIPQRREKRGVKGFQQVRICNKSLRDLRVTRLLARGEGREFQPLKPLLEIHSDAADVCYGDTLGLNIRDGAPGSWEAQGLWRTEERQQ